MFRRRFFKYFSSPSSTRDLIVLVICALAILIVAVNRHLLDVFVAWYVQEDFDPRAEAAIFLVLLLVLGLALFSVQRWRELRRVIRLQDATEEALRTFGEASQRHADQMSALNHMGQTVLASLDPNRVLEQVIAEVGTLFHEASGISLLLKENDELVFAAVGGQANVGLLGHKIPRGAGITSWVVENGRSIRVTDPESQGRIYRGLEAVNGFRTQSIIGVPLCVGTETIGVLVGVSPNLNAFDDNDLKLLEGAGHWASIAIENARHYKAVHLERSFAQALVNISNTLNNSLEPDVVLDRILESVGTVAVFDQVSVRLVNEDLARLIGICYRNAPGVTYPDPSPTLDVGLMPLLRPALEENQTVIVTDTEKEPQWVKTPENHWIHSYLIAPIETHGILLGLLSLKSATPDFYTKADAARVRSFAALAATTLERSQLYERLLQRSQRLALVNQVGQLALATLDVHTLLQSVADLLRQARRYPNLGILLIEEGDFVLYAVSGEMGELPSLGYRQPVDVGVMGHANRIGKSYRVAEMEKDAHYYAPAPQLTTRSELAVPIRLGSTPLGIINIESERANAFDEEDVLVVETIADQIAAAIHNAQLFEETKVRAQQFRLLYDTTRDMMAEFELGPFLSALVERATKLLRTEYGYLFAYDETRQELELLVGRGTPAVVGTRVALGIGVVGRAARERRTVYVEDYQQWEHHVQSTSPIKIHAMLAVPLVFRGQLVGVLGAHEFTPARKFSEQEVHLLELFAGQVASLVHTVRLFQETQEHLAELMVLHQASQDLNKTLDLNATARTVANHFRGALDPDTCTLLVLDEARANLVTLYDSDPLGSTNSPVGSVYPITMLSYFEQVTRDPEVLVFQGDDESLQPALRAEMERLRWNSLMVVPLVQRGVSIGLVELGVRSGTQQFTTEQIRLATSLANQAAVAIENARLYQETRIQSEHLEKALETEQKMRHQLVQADKLSALGRMVASIAHEVNNPLQSLQNCLYILSQPTTTPEKREHYVSVALSEIDRLANLIVQLRSVYRPSLTRASQAEPLGQMIEQVTLLVAPHLERNHVRLEQTPIPAALGVVEISESLRQVLINLALNAVDAMQPDGGTLGMRLVESEDKREFGIVMQDNGRGIEPDALPHIFEPFYSTKEMGMGLGLAVCYDIVYRNGGRIEVESQMNKGTRFSIWLPLETMVKMTLEEMQA